MYKTHFNVYAFNVRLNERLLCEDISLLTVLTYFYYTYSIYVYFLCLAL